MEKKSKYAVVIVVLVVVIAAIGIYALTANKDKESDNENDLTILVQDNYGVFMWMKGNGVTADLALIDAKDKCGVDIDYSYFGDGEDRTMFLTEINGLAGSISEPWLWWKLYVYEDDAWVYSEDLGLSSIKSADYEYIGLFYGDGETEPTNTPDVDNARIWFGETKGTLFTIQSKSGFYFRFNGEGETVYDALVNADEKYDLWFEGSESSYGKGVQSLIGKDMKQEGEIWYWWSTYVLNESARGWDSSAFMLSNLLSADNPQICFMYTYSDDTSVVTAPIYV